MERSARREGKNICEHCGRLIQGNGGKFILPTEITGLPERWTYVHNKCLNSYLDEWEQLCKPITPRTIFENGNRRDLPGI